MRLGERRARAAWAGRIARSPDDAPRRKAITVAVLAILAIAVRAGPAAASDPGPAVGTAIPAITARDAGGVPRTFQDLVGPNGVVLIFFRSARWCAYCESQLISLRATAPALARSGYGLAAISYDQPDVLAAFALRRDIAYRLLSDDRSRTIEAFGLRDPQYRPGDLAYGVARPMVLVVSPKGMVRARLGEASYKAGSPQTALLSAIARLDAR